MQSVLVWIWYIFQFSHFVKIADLFFFSLLEFGVDLAFWQTFREFVIDLSGTTEDLLRLCSSAKAPKFPPIFTFAWRKVRQFRQDVRGVNYPQTHFCASLQDWGDHNTSTKCGLHEEILQDRGFNYFIPADIFWRRGFYKIEDWWRQSHHVDQKAGQPSCRNDPQSH